jgi:DNA-binding transcriptional ArsR family regulator
MPDDLSHVHLDARQIRVLAHPLRSRLVGELRLHGPATATQLASAFGTNTGATSYHLRQLAEAGLVEEDEGSGRGRERWWRARHDVTSWERDDYAGDPDATAAADWLTSQFAMRMAERVEEWNRGVGGESPEWRAAVRFSDWILRLDAAQLTGMTAELEEVVERWRRATTESPSPDAREVLLYLYPVPLAVEGEP